eukprot:GHRQ01026664.1.p1 GENE.GHRQ01026664.1~~GHRQ01026664.1.p1  ORF type:complete len:112 (-),score=0.11 GHRQ01026664.1:258-593(-)
MPSETSNCLRDTPARKSCTRLYTHSERQNMHTGLGRRGTACCQNQPVSQPVSNIKHTRAQQPAHLSTSTVSATSRGLHSAWGKSFSTPLAGPTVTEAVTNLRRSNSSPTMR